MDRWDIFLSYARRDVLRARPLAAALRDRGLRVFVDETDVRDFRSITRLIGTALGNSRIMLALYSKAYQHRPACQMELTLAYLAGQQEGDPRRRVIVVNPEASADHVHPIELRDARHWPATGGAQLELIDLITEHLKEVGTPIGSVLPLAPPRWLPHPRPLATPSVDDTAQLPSLWQLHSALHPHSAALITGRLDPGVAVIHGPAAADLAHLYAAKFASAYPYGIFWFSAKNFENEVAIVRSALDPVSSASDLTNDLNRLAVLMDGPNLWVISDIPPGLTAPTTLLAPNALGSTILISQSSEYDHLGTPLTFSSSGGSMGEMPDLVAPTDRERLAAFDLQVELVTRIGVQHLGADSGSLREALTSLKSLFDTTRTIFHGYGPSVKAMLQPAEQLLGILRPFLEKWHPRLSAHEHARPTGVSSFAHEQAWSEAATMRSELSSLSEPLREVVRDLSHVSGSGLGVES